MPHTSFYGGPNVARSPILYDTADRVSVAVSKTVVDRASDKREPYVADARRIVAAHKRRQRALAAIDERSGYNAACKHDEDLLVLITEAEAAFYATPAANPAELSFKIGVLIERDAWGDDAVPALIASDVRRIAGEGR